MARQLSIFDILEEQQPKTKAVGFSTKEIREYIENQYKACICQDGFIQRDYLKNAILTHFFPLGDSYLYKCPLAEQYEAFRIIYDSYDCLYQDNNYEVFTIKHEYINTDDEWAVFIRVTDDYIVELPRVKSLDEEMTAPACAIWWYDAEGNFTNDYMRLKDGESITTDGVKIYGSDRDEDTYSYKENRKDRRNYFFFNLLGIQHYGKKRSFIDDKRAFDGFTSFEWKLQDMIKWMEVNRL